LCCWREKRQLRSRLRDEGKDGHPDFRFIVMIESLKMHSFAFFRHVARTASFSLAIGCALQGASAQTSPPPANPPPASASEQSRAGAVDPAAIQAFERMSAYIASLPALAFDTTYAFDLVTDAGQTITIDGEGHYRAVRPNKLRVTLDNDLFSRTFIYDGENFVIVSPDDHYYAKTPMQGPIRDVLAKLAATYGIEIPLADVFELGSAKGIGSVVSAFKVGPTTIGGVEAEHYAYRTDTRDWEVWIRTGDKPVPVRLTLIDRAQASAPRLNVSLVWQDPANVGDVFAFSPTPDQKQIGIRLVPKNEPGSSAAPPAHSPAGSK